jgi:hypothetical protein
VWKTWLLLRIRLSWLRFSHENFVGDDDCMSSQEDFPWDMLLWSTNSPNFGCLTIFSFIRKPDQCSWVTWNRMLLAFCYVHRISRYLRSLNWYVFCLCLVSFENNLGQFLSRILSYSLPNPNLRTSRRNPHRTSNTTPA